MMLVPLMATAQNSTEASDSTSHEGGWTLQQCIDYALENNIDVKNNNLSIESAEVDISEGKGKLMPSLNFSTGHNFSWRPWSESTVSLSDGTFTSTESETTYSGSYSLSANWTVWDGGRTRRQLEGYKLSAEQAEYNAQQTVNTIEEQIVQYYVQILYQTDASNVADSLLEGSKVIRDRAKTMMEVGSLARVDYVQLEAQTTQDEYSAVSSRTQLANYKLQLKQILEIVKSTDFDVAIPDVNDDKILVPLPTIDDVYAQALETRPEVKNAQLEIEQADLQERIARAGHYPTLALSAGVSTSHNTASDDGIGSQIKQNVNNTIGISLSVPILDNRSTRSSKSRAKIQRQQSELNQQDTEKEIYMQVETYWLNASSAQMEYRAALANAQSMRESYDLVCEQFSLGLKNIAELTTGKTNLLQAEQQLLQARYTALLNIALLKFYAGEPMTL